MFRSDGSWESWVLELPAKKRNALLLSLGLGAKAEQELKQAARKFKQRKSQREYARRRRAANSVSPTSSAPRPFGASAWAPTTIMSQSEELHQPNTTFLTHLREKLCRKPGTAGTAVANVPRAENANVAGKKAEACSAAGRRRPCMHAHTQRHAPHAAESLPLGCFNSQPHEAYRTGFASIHTMCRAHARPCFLLRTTTTCIRCCKHGLPPLLCSIW